MEKSQTTFQAAVTDEKKSPLQKYQETVLGKPGLGYLIKFELIMLLCNWIPGALGFLLRKIFYKSLFGEIGRGVVFGRNVVLRVQRSHVFFCLFCELAVHCIRTPDR